MCLTTDCIACWKWNKPGYVLILQTQALRETNLVNVCTKFSEIQPTPNFTKARHLLVDDRLRYIFCYTPKVACTTWKRILLMMTGKMTVNRSEDIARSDVHSRSFMKRHLPSLNSYRPDEIEYRINHYFKFMFVRDPFERLVSAYLDKFVRTNTFQKTIGRDIIKLYRPDATTEALNEGSDVTFQEFVRYILDERTRTIRPFNEHWRPLHQLCYPCYIKYDFIGKFETLHEDAKYVLKRSYFTIMSRSNC